MPGVLANTFYIYTMTILTNAKSSTSFTYIGNDRPTIWSLMVPTATAYCITGTCNVRLQGSVDGVTPFTIGYSNNPATTSSGYRAWEVPQALGFDNAMVICEAAQFSPWIMPQITNTATVTVALTLVGKPI